MAKRRGMGADKDMQDLLKWALGLGFTCERTRGSHVVFRRPNTMPVFAAWSPSDHRARLNNRRDLKHALIESEQRLQGAT